MEFYNKGTNQALIELSTSKNGLSSEETEKRIQLYGKNELEIKEDFKIAKLFLNQFKSFLIWILIAASGISWFLGAQLDALIIIAIVVIIAVLGFVQEYKAEKALEALQSMSVSKCKVIREEKEIEIDSKELVVGDIIVVVQGDKIPADARLLETHNLEINESVLTGESLPVQKNILVLEGVHTLGEQKNILFSNTIVTKGIGKAVVFATGNNTAFGKIGEIIQSMKDTETPLAKKLDRLGRKLAVLFIGLTAMIFLVGIFISTQYTFTEVLLTTVSLAVSAIPEGLPAIVTISLALGAQQMAGKKAIVRKMSAVESLGSTTVICTDKTGTLTKNELMVKEIYANGRLFKVTGSGRKRQGEFYLIGKKFENFKEKGIKELFENFALCTTSKIGQKTGTEIGDPTEIALMVAAGKGNHSKKELEKEMKLADLIEFDSDRKMMSVIYEEKGKKKLYCKGANKNVLNNCTHYFEKGLVKKMTPQAKNSFCSRKTKWLLKD